MNVKTRGLVWTLALLGAALGGAAGYAAGWFVIPEIMNSGVRGDDNSGPAWMGAWVVAVLGGIGGAQWGRAIVRQQRHKAYQHARRERYADQLNRFQKEKEAEQADEAAREAQRRASRSE